MKNKQHQVLFKISYKTCILKDIKFSVTMGPFVVKNDVIFSSQILAPFLNLIVTPKDELCKVLCFGHDLNNLPFSGWLTAQLTLIAPDKLTKISLLFTFIRHY